MSFQAIADVLPANGQANFNTYLPFLNTILATYKVDTVLRQAHFLAQVAHESGGFLYNKENLNYSAQGLRTVFPKYFMTLQYAAEYARQPERIANVVYAGRLGNGDPASGDGWRFRGRGLIQLTGRDNYTAYAKDSGQDVINNPNQLLDPQWSADVAGWFWQKRGLNSWADKNDVHKITKLINGGYNGLSDRVRYLGLFMEVLNV